VDGVPSATCPRGLVTSVGVAEACESYIEGMSDWIAKEPKTLAPWTHEIQEEENRANPKVARSRRTPSYIFKINEL